MARKSLPAKQARFVELFLVSLNASGAYREAYGCSEKVANRNGPRLLATAGVSSAVAAAQAARSQRTSITADDVLRRFWLIASADPRELVEYRRTCCRFCHSINHEYQRTQAELDRDRRSWEKAQTKSSKEEFDVAGGVGYNATKPPHAGCPECFGEGVERVYIHDTRRLSPAAVALYAGVKQTKDGLEVKLQNQLDALGSVAKHLGMFAEPKEPALSEDERIARLRAALAAMDRVTASAA